MTHLSLFTGIGGLDLAAEAAGFITVGQCEYADYPTKVMERHWPDVPRWKDIRTLTGESFYEWTGLRTVDVISGGFPCQPFSCAGKRRGKEDDRYLWPEMLRVIQELRPGWVVGENVANIVNMALDTVLSDLETIGYTCRAFVIPACAVDAPHRRDRCAILAHANGERCNQFKPAAIADQAAAISRPNYAGNVPDTDREMLEGTVTDGDATGGAGPAEYSRKQRPAQPGVGGGHDGLSFWMDSVRTGWADGTWEYGIVRIARNVLQRVNRLKCLGNAVVPAQFYPIFQAIADIETKNLEVWLKEE